MLKKIFQKKRTNVEKQIQKKIQKMLKEISKKFKRISKKNSTNVEKNFKRISKKIKKKHAVSMLMGIIKLFACKLQLNFFFFFLNLKKIKKKTIFKLKIFFFKLKKTFHWYANSMLLAC